MAKDEDPHGWRQEGKDLLRGIAAGSIVGMPLLYTMEMWWHGSTSSELYLVALLAVTVLLNSLFCLFSGLRTHFSLWDALFDGVTAVGIGFVYSALVLWLIQAITLDMHLTDILGRILLETAAVSLGVSFANSQIKERSRSGDEQKQEGGSKEPDDPAWAQLKDDLNDVAATLAGATVFAISVAPTEEITLIAARLQSWQRLALFAFSLVLCYLILFAAGFRERKVHVASLFQHPLVETVMAYALSLGVAFGLLYLLGGNTLMYNLDGAVGKAVVLSLPAVVGGAAGRLIV